MASLSSTTAHVGTLPRARGFGMLAIYLALALGGVLMLLPFAWMLSASLKSLNEILQIPPTWIPRRANFGNYAEVFRQQPLFGRYLLNSIVVAVIAVVGVLLTSTLAGYAFAKFDFPGKRILFIFVLSTMMIPFQIRMVPLYVMVSSWGVSDTYLGLALPGLVDAFGIFLMRQFIASIPNDLLDAARIDGASEPGIFARIMLPLTIPALSALSIFTLIGNWEAFIWPLLITNKEAMRTLPIGLALFAGRYLQRLDLQMAAATIAILPMVLAFLVLQKQFIQGVTLSGLKG